MYLNYINSFRAIAILFIVAGHSVGMTSIQASDSSDLLKLLKIVLSNGTTLFVFIAGYLFQHLSKKYNYKKYMLGKLKFVLAPYFLVSIPAIIYYVVFAKRTQVWTSFYYQPEWLQVIMFYISGLHLGPLWFIPMITIFYLISPLLITLDKTKWFYYLLPVFFVVSYLTPRGGLVLINFVHFFSVYVFGMWCSHYKQWLNSHLTRTLILLLLFLLYLTLIAIDFYNISSYVVNSFQKLTLSLFIIGIFIRLGSLVENKVFDLLANFSFGIFFIHAYILFIALNLPILNIEFFHSKYDILCQSTFSFMFTLFISILVVSTVKKYSSNYSRYILGS